MTSERKGGIVSNITDLVVHTPGPREHASYDGRTDPAEVSAKQMDAVAKSAFDALRTYGNCCRSTLWALQIHLHLDGQSAFRAATTLAGGIAGTGETCGAVLGALMALGLAASRDHPTESDASGRSMATAFVNRFSERFGGTRCYGVQESIMGWCCDDPGLVEKWITAGGPTACAGVCGEAARLAAEIIQPEPR
jgi:C_GCAxxG_C_C family probable redox protein